MFSSLNQLGFVRKEIGNIPGIEKKPQGGFKSFTSRIKYALSLGFKEKEILAFGLLQWAAIGVGYLLWVQMLDWIPESVWRAAAASDSEGPSGADIVLFLWSFVCVGVVAFPVGILTGCMGAAHFLHKQKMESTVAACLMLVAPRSWTLWSFHWIEGWITVLQILERLPRKNKGNTTASEAAYHAWKLGIAGVLPSILTGNGLIQSGKNSVLFVFACFLEVAKLRAGYSLLCWIVGIGSYISTFFFIKYIDFAPKSEEIYGYIYEFYLIVAVPILIAVAIVMLVLRPIYVLSICDLYSDYLESKEISVEFPSNPSKLIGATIAFSCLCFLVAFVYLFRVELGIVEVLSTPHD